MAVLIIAGVVAAVMAIDVVVRVANRVAWLVHWHIHAKHCVFCRSSQYGSHLFIPWFQP